MNNPIVILGSSRSDGDTRQAVDKIIGKRDIPVVDLNALSISPYDYTHNNKNDDYLPLMRRVIQHDLIILATPVYWYTMSAQMKIFIDRLSDLLSIEKDLGRELRGKSLFVVANYNTSLPEGFEFPFSQTCSYMGMTYLGTSFIYVGQDEGLKAPNEGELQKALKFV